MEAAYGTEIPQYDTTGTSTMHPLGNGGYEICIQGSSRKELVAYAESLSKEGFLLYSTKSISAGSESSEDNLFYTYVGKDVNLYLSWNPGLETARVIMTPKELLPSKNIPQVSAKDNVTENVTQMQLDGVGMLYVVQLIDGSFIVIDGGTNTYDSDKERLYDYLCEKTTDTIPVIACWMFTHPDPDHIGLAERFIKNYAGLVQIKSFAYNFADESFTTNGTQDDAAIIESISRLETNMETYYPHALRYNIHAGQSYYFKGVEIEILQTEEELFPNVGATWNDTSATWRMKFHTGQTALFLGDSMAVFCQQLEDTYGDYMKSDILQLAHHGLIGGDLELYQFINPDICFWSTTEERFNGTDSGYTHQYCLGEGGCTYNAYLRDDAIKQRIHYHNGHMGVVNLKDDGTTEAEKAYIMTTTE